MTGGAGFIGSHVTDALLHAGHRVRVLDNLDPQVHGPYATWPQYLSDDAERVLGDVRDEQAVDAALDAIDVVFHFAAAVGVGQSMYEIARYSSVDALGTAKLLEGPTRRHSGCLVGSSTIS